MQQRAEKPQGPSQSQADGDDSHVLDAAVGHQPLQVPLHQDQEPGHNHGHHAEDQQQTYGESRPYGTRDNRVVAHHSIHGAVEQNRREQRADGRGSFGVRVRQPAVHGNEADLGSIADDDKNKRELHQVRVEPNARRGIHQRNPIQRRGRIHARLDRGKIQHDGPEQREGDSHGADDQILPAGLHRAFGVVEADEQRGGQRRSFHHDPQQAEIRGEADADHREEKQENQGVEPARRRKAAFSHVAQVARGIDQHEPGNDRDAHQEESAQAVGAQIPSLLQLAARVNLPDDGAQRGDFHRSQQERNASGRSRIVEKQESSPAPRSGMASGSRRSIPSAPQPSQLGHVQVVKRVADAEREDSHQKQSHENVEEDSNFDDQRHAECRDQERPGKCRSPERAVRASA